MTEIDYAARVQRGAALLDEKWPTWAQDIDLEILDIEDGYRCMTAQYSISVSGEGNWADGMRRLGLDRQSYAKHGFNGEEDDEGLYVPDSAYETLNALWRSLILQRRSAAKSPEVNE